ncbi:guanylyl cyclase-activating protein 3 [Eublepharis macularius]|uniref:Guanylyl cyclase-activating protein 3 n=1 Tax=Eublepharis macularius TaxID=481883 RepID=A0AA97J318_EUBMA|nr:guanylyl cyclase-activating protein 3 [Eublepharis macularius]
MGANESGEEISIQEAYNWYNKFMTDCPSGQLTLYECKAFLGLHGMNPDADHYVDQVFNTFDLNKDGFIDFLEFIAAINLIIRGKIDQKLKWYFKLYDADGNGAIEKRELVKIFRSVQAITGNQDTTPEEFTEMVFEKVDINHDEEISLKEFINGVERDENLFRTISKFFDLSNVLKIIQGGRKKSKAINRVKLTKSIRKDIQEKALSNQYVAEVKITTLHKMQDKINHQQYSVKASHTGVLLMPA